MQLSNKQKYQGDFQTYYAMIQFIEKAYDEVENNQPQNMRTQAQYIF